jgi:chromosome segregation ATPase
MKSLGESLSTLKANLSGLEEKISAQESRFNEGLNRQRDFLASSKEDMVKYLNTEISTIRKTLERKSREESRASLAEFKAEIKRISGTEEEVKGLRKLQDTTSSRLQKQVSELSEGLKGAYPEIKLLETRLSDIETAYKGLEKNLAESTAYHKTSDTVIQTNLTKYIDSSIKSLDKAISAKLDAAQQASMSELKSEFSRIESIGQELAAFRNAQEKRMGEFSANLAGLSDPLTDLKALERKTQEIGDIVIALEKRDDVARERYARQSGSLEKRLGIMESAVSELRDSNKSLYKLAKTDNQKLQKSLAMVLSDRKALEAELLDQRSKMSELIKEMKSI